MRVLVADDSGVMRKMIIRSLEAIDITDIVEACDGAGRFDLSNRLLRSHLDRLEHARKDGLELIQDVRGSESDIPIMPITTVEQRDAVATAYEAGVNDFLTKPFTTDDLLIESGRTFAC
ncbi:MAG: response regulator [Pirellulales bacterium]